MTTTRAALSGFALVVVLSMFLVGLGAGPSMAGAAELEPCEATQPTGPIIDLEGELTLDPTSAILKAWKRAGIKQTLVRPANQLTGRPTFPVRKVKYKAGARVDLKGGFKLTRKGRSVAFRDLNVYSKAGKPAWIRGKVGKKEIFLFKVQGGRRIFVESVGELSRTGTARLTAAAAKQINRALNPGRDRLKAGRVWGKFNLYSLYKVTEVDDPTGEVPDVPPVKAEPTGALAVSSAATVKWFVRDTFINYVASGEGTRVEDGATADPRTGPNSLVYSFNFPFANGWTVPAQGEEAEKTLIMGSGTVGFRYCLNTINFTASEPEIEIDGDDNSRLIFKVNGVDGTAFPNQRAVMVKLIPSQATSYSKSTTGGVTTVSYEHIPGFIPAEATGIFAGFYPAYSSTFEGQNPRPDRFGSFSVTYSYSDPES